jgi:hypothetical protein
MTSYSALAQRAGGAVVLLVIAFSAWHGRGLGARQQPTFREAFDVIDRTQATGVTS